MKTLIITDIRVYKVNDKYYSTNPFHVILKRYSNKFKNISLLTRIVEKDEIPNNYEDITNTCSKYINIISIKNAIFIKKNNSIIKEIQKHNFVILRMPSLISCFLFKYIKQNKCTYMTEVMGCAWDALWNHSLIGKIIAPYAFFKMKKMVYNANYSIYVTHNFLQNRYPCKNENIGVSNVNINSVSSPKKFDKKKNYTMMTAAAIDVKYKGQKYVIKAINKLNKKNIYIKYYLAGGGNNKYLMKYVNKYKLQDQVVFMGVVDHNKLLEQMNKIDFYIQPSLQEGLPRSVIEAMSQGCVCFGSTTAGIPELIKKEQLFKRKNVKSIVNIIEKNLNKDLNEISKQNILEAKKYLTNNLDKKRYLFYDEIIKNING